MDNIRKIEAHGKGFWSTEALASFLKLSPEATAVFCSRAVARGDLVRIKRELYVLPAWIGKASDAERFSLSNLLQTPSYISLLTALSFFGVSTQIPQSVCEAVATVRSARYEVAGFIYQFTRLPKHLYGGYRIENGAFVATPEKAFVDAVYLCSLGRYSLDLDAIDFSRLDRKKIDAFLKKYPGRTNELVRKWMEEK